MIWRNIWRRKARSLLTAMGIAIGVAAVVALSAMAEGIAEGYAAFAGGSSGDLLVMQGDVVDLSVSNVDEEVGERIAQLAAVDNVSGVIFFIVPLGDIPYFSIGGYDPDQVAIEHFKIVEGETLSGDKQVLLGRQAAVNLKKTIGDTIKLYEAPFRVVGIYETGQSFEEGGAVIPLADAQAIFKKPRQVTFFEIQVEDPAQVDAVRTRIEQIFKTDLTVTQGSEVGDQQLLVQSLRAMGWGISFVAVLIGGLGMMNTMIMSVYEQTREIGVLRAVGWQRNRVMRLVLTQSLVLSMIGGLIGIGIGLGLIWLVNRTPAVSSLAPAVVRPPILMQGIGVALLLGLVGGFYPAWRAAGLSPIEALRYESGASDEHGPAWARAFGMAFRNLLRRRTRSLLTVIGIAIGVGLIVALGAITQGMIKELTAFASQGGAELVAMQAGVADMGISVIDERVGRAVAAMPEVQDVSGVIMSVSSGEDVPFLFVFGLEPNERAIRHYHVIKGDQIRGRGEVMLGRTAAESLNKRVGDRMKLQGGVFRVTGIYETGLAYEEGGAVIAMRDAQVVFQKPRQVTMFQVKLHDPDQAESVRAQVEDRFGEDVAISLATSFVENTNNIKSTQAMVGAVFVLAVLVGGVVVTNTMVMAVLERTREIGTLRALGWRELRVLWMILSESLLLTLVAAGLGVLIGYSLTAAMSAAPGMGASIKPAYTPQLIAQAIAVSLFLGVAGGMYPAWYASRLRPVEALRYE